MHLRRWLPYEETQILGAALVPLLDCEVILSFDGRDVPWIGKHRNVLNWCVVQVGSRYKAVGWNENVAVGWSFPVVGISQPVFDRLKLQPQRR